MSIESIAGVFGRPIAVLDIETSGGNRETNAVVEIAIKVYGFGCEHAGINALIDPEGDISYHASRIHGITKVDVEGKHTLEPYCERIKWILEECIVVGYNSNSSDIPVIINAARRYGHEIPVPNKTIDLYRVWVRLSGEREGKLADVARRYGVTPGKAHRALGDVETTASLLEAMAEWHGLEDIVFGSPLKKLIQQQ